MKRAAKAARDEVKARILLVDDHPILRGGLIRLLEKQSDLVCCGEAGDVAEAKAAIAKLKPDLAIVDLRLNGSDSLEFISTTCAQYPALKLLVLSQYDTPLYVERALRAGAMGYVVKMQAPAEIVTAIRTVLAGEVYVSRGLAGLLLHRFVGRTQKTSSPGMDKLTDRELHVLQLLGAGLSTRKVAVELKVSFKTVESHRENIKRKLGLKGAAELVHFANRWSGEHVSLPPGALPESRPGATLQG
jgi:two-component system response regulator NreC